MSSCCSECPTPRPPSPRAAVTILQRDDRQPSAPRFHCRRRRSNRPAGPRCRSRPAMWPARGPGTPARSTSERLNSTLAAIAAMLTATASGSAAAHKRSVTQSAPPNIRPGRRRRTVAPPRWRPCRPAVKRPCSNSSSTIGRASTRSPIVAGTLSISIIASDARHGRPDCRQIVDAPHGGTSPAAPPSRSTRRTDRSADT